MRSRSVAACLVVLICTSQRLDAQEGATPAYRDPQLPVAERVRDLLGRMTREEKFWQLFMIPGDLDDPAHDYSHGIFGLQIPTAHDTAAIPAPGPAAIARAHAERINAIQRFFVERTRLGIPIIPFDEALHGLMRAGATSFPQAIGLAATWDSALVRRVSAAAARETRSRGVRQALSPVVNIASDVRWGRVEETYGEDPHLAAVLGRAFVQAFEREGVIATPKHFVANVGEGGRDSYPIDLSQRALEERFYPPFEVAIREGGARSIMTAYNSVDGSPATQNARLLNQKLKGDWRFTGFVISDAAATGGATVLHMTEPNTPAATQHALESGLDVIFQSSYEQHRPYRDAFVRGMIADSVIDAAVSRVLRAKFELGLFEQPYVNADSAAHWNGHVDHRTVARDAARASIVLLRNASNTLPLNPSLRSVAVIGPDAVEARLGGYSGPGNAPISILDGIRAKVGARAVRYAPGPGRARRSYAVVPGAQLRTRANGAGLRGEYFDNNRLAGEPRVVRTDAEVDFGWTLNAPARGIPFDWYSVRWTGSLITPAGGVRRLGVEGNDGWRLFLDGRLLIDNWTKRSYGARLAEVTLAPGSSHDLRLEYFESTGNARVKLIWDTGTRDEPSAAIDSAVALVRQSDVAIIVAGTDEGEFRDRASLALPGHQERLIERVSAAGKPVVVILVSGGAVTMSSWLERAGAVLHTWFPGEEGGNAVADVLFGSYNPAGRLPITFPVSEGQLPLYYNHKPTGRGDDYVDLTGQPLFPFGFGLSYTTFEYSDLRIEPSTIGPRDSAVVHVRVRNTGSRAGDEVAQLYLRDELASVARPVMQLAGFTRVHLNPGQSGDIAFTVTSEHLRLLDRDMRWVVEPGRFRVMIGGSSKDIQLRGHLTVQ